MTDSAVAARPPASGETAPPAADSRPPGTTRSRSRWQRASLAPVLLVAAYLLLGLAWVFSNPPGFAPDEPEHYIKAVGIGHGEFRGEPAPFTYLPVVDAEMLRWQNLNTRTIQVPAGMGACLYYRVPIYDRCPEGPPIPTPGRETTYVASYPPFMYVGAAALMRLGHDTDTALRLGRLATLLLSTALVAGAAAALAAGRGGGALPLVGLLTAVTPMVLFTSSELSASGPEIAGGICFAAALIRLAAAERPPRWLWPLLLLSATVLALSRTFGPVWVAFDLAWAVALLGAGQARARLRAHRGWAWASASAVSVAVVANLAWQVAVAPHPGVGGAALRHGLAAVLRDGIRLVREFVGVFGWIDVPLPRRVYLPWLAIVAVVLAAAFIRANRRERWVLLGVAGGIAALTVAVAVAIAASAPGFKMQTRYVLPVAVALPLLAGEMAWRHRDSFDPRPLRVAVPAIFLVAAAVQAGSLAVNGQFYRHNVNNLVFFIVPPGWRPPLGWLPWIALTLLGTALVAAAGLPPFRREQRSAAP